MEEYSIYNGQALHAHDALSPYRYEVYVGAYNISFIKEGLAPKYPTVRILVKNVIKVYY